MEKAAGTIAAGFEISEAEVLLLAETAGAIAVDVDALSAVYRRVLLARALKLGVQELAWLEELYGPLTSRGQIRPFVEAVLPLTAASR
jgi:hypothetical protein